MRCSLKDGFVILLIFSFAPFEGKSYPSNLHKSSIADRLTNFNDLPAMSRVEQSLDSFPKLGDYNKNSHKIVKKQMTASDYKRTPKNKRSTFSIQESSNFGDSLKCQCRENSKQAIADSTSNDSCKREKSAFSNLKHRRNLGIEAKFFDRFKGDIFPGLPSDSKEKLKQINENKKQQIKEKKMQKLVEKQMEAELHKSKESLKKAQSIVENPIEPQISEEQKANVKAIEELCRKSLQAEKKGLEDLTKKGLNVASPKTTENTLAEKTESLNKPKVSLDYKSFQFNDSGIKEEYKALRNMVGCSMGRFCRLPDVQNNYGYFECESDESGCIKLKYKNCPKGEIFSSKFLECVKPFFWEIVERQKRSLWKKEKKQYSKTSEGGQFANAWTDVTHEEGRQFPLEIRPKCKPKLVVFHLKVKKSVNEDFQKGKKEQRHALHVPNLARSEMNRRVTQKVANLRKKHQLFPRSFIIRINKKEGGKSDHEESVSEDETDETEDNGDDEDDEEDDEEVKDDEETSEEEEDTEDEDEDKPEEKSGIKEFFKSAKEAITNKAKFNEPADTSFTLDKTNSYTKNKKFDGSDTDSKKVLIDADIKVDKALGKTLKRILGKRKDENFSTDGNIINDRGSQDLMESEQITKYENLIKTNPRLKRYFLASLGEKEN